jgi:hypothetical protein
MWNNQLNWKIQCEKKEDIPQCSSQYYILCKRIFFAISV